MKILTILGSPQKAEKTATVLKFVEEKITAKGDEIIRVNAAEKLADDILSTLQNRRITV